MSGRRVLVFAGIATILAAGLLVYPLRAQEASRMALTGALVEEGSVSIDGFPIGIDRAVKEDRTYSDKAPGQPVIAVPAYVVTQWLGFSDARTTVVDRNLTLWFVTVWSATVPAVALFLGGQRLAALGGDTAGAWSAAALVTGTILFPFSTILFGHVMAALFLGGALLALRFDRPLAAGLLAGMAVAVEYTAAIGVMVLTGWILWRHRDWAKWFLAGGTLPAAGLAVYNQIAFGSPLRFSYQYSAFENPPADPGSVLELFTRPVLENVVLFLVSGRGILIATPVVVGGVIGTVSLIREDRSRDLGIVCLAIFLSFSLLPIFWSNPFGGDSPGPRYLTPGLMFLAPGLAVFWRRRRRLAVGLWMISAFTMAVATFTDALVITRNDPAGLSTWLRIARDGQWMPNVLGVLLGGFGNWLFVVLVLSGFAVLLTTMVKARPESDAPH